EDVVAQDGVAGAVIQRDGTGKGEGGEVERDDVARPLCRPPDHVAGAIDFHPPQTVAQGGGPGGVGPDVVPLHHVRRAAEDVHAVAAVGGDDVAGAGRGASDDVVRIPDDHPVAPVAKGGGAGGIGADVVPLHHVPRAVEE